MIYPNYIEIFRVGYTSVGPSCIEVAPTQFARWNVIKDLSYGVEPALINGYYYVPLVCQIRGQEVNIIARTSDLSTLQDAIQNITSFQVVSSDFDWWTEPLFQFNPHRQGPYFGDANELHAH